MDWQHGDHILISDCENPGIVAAIEQVARRFRLHISNFRVDASENETLESIARGLRSDTRLVVVSHVLWNTGQVLPLTTFETEDPFKLWQWMAAYEQKTGGQVLAIPHNGNLSNGRMFEEQQFDGSPLTPEWAQMRERYERLFEVTQIKGQSESHPSLSPTDEFAAWDLWDRGNLIMKPKPKGALRTEYWREALKSGLRLEGRLGTNPFRYGANVYDTARKLQRNIRSAIENYTGLMVDKVDVTIRGMIIDAPPGGSKSRSA